MLDKNTDVLKSVANRSGNKVDLKFLMRERRFYEAFDFKDFVVA